MSKEMNNLLQKAIKNDLGSGLLISLVIGFIYSFMNAGIYLLGICVALTNFLISGKIISNYLGKEKKQWIIVITSYLRMALIIITILPMIKNIEYIIYYMIGFISHYLIIVVSNIKNRKGSD